MKARHLENNTFDQSDANNTANAGFGSSLFGGAGEDGGDGGRGCYIEGDQVQVIVVSIRDGRTVDWKGGAKMWTVADAGVNGA